MSTTSKVIVNKMWSFSLEKMFSKFFHVFHVPGIVLDSGIIEVRQTRQSQCRTVHVKIKACTEYCGASKGMPGPLHGLKEETSHSFIQSIFAYRCQSLFKVLK